MTSVTPIVREFFTSPSPSNPPQHPPRRRPPPRRVPPRRQQLPALAVSQRPLLVREQDVRGDDALCRRPDVAVARAEVQGLRPRGEGHQLAAELGDGVRALGVDAAFEQVHQLGLLLLVGPHIGRVALLDLQQAEAVQHLLGRGRLDGVVEVRQRVRDLSHMRLLLRSNAVGEAHLVQRGAVHQRVEARPDVLDAAPWQGQHGRVQTAVRQVAGRQERHHPEGVGAAEHHHRREERRHRYGERRLHSRYGRQSRDTSNGLRRNKGS